MAKQDIGLGTVDNDGNGDDLKTAGGKINGNFGELYTALGDGTTLALGTAVAAAIDADDISDAATTKKFTTAAQISKLAGIEALADVTDTTNVVAALNTGDNLLMTAAERSKLTGVEAAADVTDTTNVVAALNTGDNLLMTAAERSKLTGVEAAADVTDATNVAAALTLTGDVTSTGFATTIASGVSLTNPKIVHSYNPQTGLTYTLALTDASKILSMSNAAANTLTIPPNASVAFPIGTIILIWALGAGTTTIEGGAGVTLTGNGGSGATYSADIQTRYNAATIMKIDTDQWLISGDIDTVAA